MNNDVESRVMLNSPHVAMPEVARRHSTGKMGTKSPISLSRSGENVLPRYLMASTGSCHDFCKYGRKHESETKVKYNFRLKFSENKVVPYKEEDSAREVNSERRKKTAPKQNYTPRIKLRPSDGDKALGRKSPAVTGFVESVECKDSEKQNSRPSFSGTISSKLCDTSQSNVEEVDSFKELHIVDQNFPPVQKEEPSENGEDHHSEAPEKAYKNFHQPQTFQSSPNKYGPPDQLDIMKPETMPIKSSRTIKESASAVGKIVPSAKLKYKKESLPVPRKAVSSTKPKGDMEKSTTRKLHASSKFVTSMTSAASTRESMCKIASPSPINVSSIPTRKANGKSKVGKKGIPPQMEMKGARPLRLSSQKPPAVHVPTLKSRSCRDTNSYSVLKNQKKMGIAKANDDAVKEKTLYVIDVREGSANSSSEQPMNNNSSPPMPSSSLLPLALSVNGQVEGTDHSRTDHIGEIDTSMHNVPDDVQAELLNDAGEKKILKRPVRIRAQANDVEAHKMKFRRGKIVDIQSASECPRKLRFRRGKGLGENRNYRGDTHKKRDRKKDMIDYRTNPEPTEVVMLRHQEQDKKDAQGLFNEVIEVTASKLVETRKSKVKALVSAFETVISLQEREPSSMD